MGDHFGKQVDRVGNGASEKAGMQVAVGTLGINLQLAEPSPADAPAVVTEKETVSESTYLAENPELGLAGRHNAAPDMSFSMRTPDELARQQNFIAAHTRRAAIEKEAISSATLAENPELAVAQRYAVARAQATDTPVLTDQEGAAQRYADFLKWQSLHQFPGR